MAAIDETKFENTQNNENSSIQQSVDESNKSKGKTVGKIIAIGGVSGVLLGAAAELSFDHRPEGNNDESGMANSGVATEDMSFAEAWSAARAQVGPNGTFEWHGNVYSTATADEWAAAHHVSREPSAVNDTPMEDTYLANADTHHAPTQINDDGVLDPSEVQVLGASVHQENYGSETVSMGLGIAEGHAAIVFDADNDGYADVLAVDRNDNLEFERHELENVHGSGITMGQAHQSMASASAQMASAPVGAAPDFSADEVQVLGVRTIDVEGEPMVAGGAMVDNHFAVAVDASGDGQFDIGIIDENDDNMFSENEVYDIRDQQVGVKEYIDQVENPMINTGFEQQDDATDSGMTAEDNLIDI